MNILTFWQVIVFLLVLVLGIVAIRISLNFDLNRYLEDKQKRLLLRAQNTCTHLEFINLDGGQLGFQSLFISPSGTLQWQCTKCKLIVHHRPTEAEVKRQAEFYLKNQKIYLKKNKKFEKLLRKAGIL